MPTHLRADLNTIHATGKDQVQTWLEPAAQALVELTSGQCRGSEWTGWLHWPEQHGQELLQKVQAWRSQMLHPYDLIVVVGIGGSFAGCKAIDEALTHSYHSYLHESLPAQTIPIVYAGHNLAENQLIELLDLLERRRILVNVISKSGSTIETSIAFRLLRQHLLARYGEQEARERTLITTDAHSGALGQLADQMGLHRFPIPPDIGGRYSVFTAVGLVPLALAGHDCQALLAGATQVLHNLEATAQTPPEENAILVYAAVRRAAWEEGRNMEVLAVADPKLVSFVEWWKQLFAESEGKEDRGLFPVGMHYSTDLHSLGQYLQEGRASMLETFLFVDQDAGPTGRVDRRLRVPPSTQHPSLDGLEHLEGRTLSEINNAAMTAARLAHSERGVPTFVLSVPSLDAYGLGQLMATMQVVCAVSAALLGVNPFDQPGVEAYKKNLAALTGREDTVKDGLGDQLRRRLRPSSTMPAPSASL